MLNEFKTVISVLIAIGFIGSESAGAKEVGASPPSSTAAKDWHYRTTLYVWAAGVDGGVDFAGRGPVPPIDASASVSFSDTLKRLDNGGMVFFEGRRDRFGFFGEFFHVQTSDSASGSVSLPPAPTVTVDADLRSTFTTALLAGQYRAIDASAGSLDLLLGARYWSLDNRVRVSESVGTLEGGFTRKVSGRWGNPVVGAKGLYHFTPKAYVTGWAMAGGLAISDYSSWDLMAAFGYSFTKRISTIVGYRYLSMEYADSSFSFDADLHGPGVGLDFRF